MVKVLDSKDIIEMFSHSQMVARNAEEVYIVPEVGVPPEAFFFISEKNGTNPIRRVIDDAQKGPADAYIKPGGLDLGRLIPQNHSIYYYNIKNGSDDLGFCILVPEGYKIKISKKKMPEVLSQIFKALTYSRGGRS